MLVQMISNSPNNAMRPLLVEHTDDESTNTTGKESTKHKSRKESKKCRTDQISCCHEMYHLMAVLTRDEKDYQHECCKANTQH